MIVSINGRKYSLCYTINSLCAIEERANMPIDRLMALQFTATRLLLWAGLAEDQPELTLRDVGTLIGEHLRGGGFLEDIIDLCAEGLREAHLLAPDEEGGEG